MKKKTLIDLGISFLVVLSFAINVFSPNFRTMFIRFPVSGICFLALFILLFQYLSKRKQKFNIWLYIVALIMSCITLISFYVFGNIEQKGLFLLIKIVIYIVGKSVLFYLLIECMFTFFGKIKYKETSSKIVKFVFDDHPILLTIIILLICYIPVLVVGYPGVFTNDGIDELRQYNHVYTWTLDFINLIDPNVYINGHHSPFHTVIIGFIYNLFDHPSIGVFANVIFQEVFQVLVFAYVMNFFKKLKINYIFRVFVLLLFIFLPFYNFSIIGIYKDIPFSISIMLYIVLLIEYFYLKERNPLKTVVLCITALLVMLLSNKGLYVIALSTAFIFVKLLDKKRLIYIFLIPIFVYLGISKILLPVLHITPGSIQEVLPLPIQQVSYYVVKHEDELTGKDKKVISDLLAYDEIKDKYQMNYADPIKNTFNKNYTKEQVTEFLKLWVKLFFKDPKGYVKSFFGLNIRYYDVNSTNGIGYFYKSRMLDPDDSTDALLIPRHESTLLKCNNFYLDLREMPVFGLLLKIAVYFWLTIIFMVYLISNKKLKYILPLIPSFVILLFLFVSPVNGNRRYVLPVIYSMPVLVAYMIAVVNGKLLDSK